MSVKNTKFVVNGHPAAGSTLISVLVEDLASDAELGSRWRPVAVAREGEMSAEGYPSRYGVWRMTIKEFGKKFPNSWHIVSRSIF